MELLKKCIYCNSIAKFTCKICGSSICEVHYDKRLGVCIGCKGKKIYIKKTNSL